MMRTTWWRIALGLGVLVVALAGGIVGLNLRDEADVAASDPSTPATSTNAAELVARGAYLARAGNCQGCHTTRGGAPYAGGLGLETPFGTVYSSNLTPAPKTGIGSWTSAHFWRALHNGRSKDGRLLYPAFPYPNYTQVTRADADALFAYLKSLPPVDQPATPHALRWPYSTQASLAVWRALYFSPGVYEPEPRQTADWNRGAYLVRGLGHCAACHASRNALGATENEQALSGGLIPMQNWYAPSLSSPAEAGVGEWSQPEIVRLLQSGVSAHGSAIGPMAEVVLNSTQYLNPADLEAMAVFLKALPQTPREPTQAQAVAATAPRGRNAERGAKLYEQHCVQCHGEQGQGVANAYPRLAGNRAVTMASTANLVQIVLNGGYAPATAGNPRPFGMPPYVLVLSDSDIAAVLTHLRTSWGNRAPEVTEFEVSRLRAGMGS